MKTKSAREKAMDYLSIRLHSREELKTKLQKNKYSQEDIDDALHHVESSGWLPSPEALAQNVRDSLERKMKSHLYIEQYLQGKGLPTLPYDSEREYEKAQNLVESHFSKLSKSKDKDKKHVAQLLETRGFDEETISRILSKDIE
jgi:SOS response regulatory protein OraA/RecX